MLARPEIQDMGSWLLLLPCPSFRGFRQGVFCVVSVLGDEMNRAADGWLENTLSFRAISGRVRRSRGWLNGQEDLR